MYVHPRSTAASRSSRLSTGELPAVAAIEAADDSSDEEEGEGNQLSPREHNSTGARPFYDSSDDEADDTAEPGTVSTYVGNAVAPHGFRFVPACPRLETDDDLNALIGKKVLYGWDSRQALGWYLGTVHSRNVTPRDLQRAPEANFVVKYIRNETEGKLHGLVACKLSADLYGDNNWWGIVERV